VISILLAPVVSRMLRFFPPVVTGTIIAIIGISLMRVGINWAWRAGAADGAADRHVPNAAVAGRR
jgi:xanthine/uracil permease